MNNRTGLSSVPREPLPVSCGLTGGSAPQEGLSGSPEPAKLDPDLVAFVEALARYAARRDHEAAERT
jgi:hypothetical protein